MVAAWRALAATPYGSALSSSSKARRAWRPPASSGCSEGRLPPGAEPRPAVRRAPGEDVRHPLELRVLLQERGGVERSAAGGAPAAREGHALRHRGVHDLRVHRASRAERDLVGVAGLALPVGAERPRADPLLPEERVAVVRIEGLGELQVCWKPRSRGAPSMRRWIQPSRSVRRARESHCCCSGLGRGAVIVASGASAADAGGSPGSARKAATSSLFMAVSSRSLARPSASPAKATRRPRTPPPRRRRPPAPRGSSRRARSRARPRGAPARSR